MSLRNGEDNVTLTKTSIAIMIFIITVLTSVTTVVAFGITLRSDVDHVTEINVNQDKQLEDLDDRLSDVEKIVPVVNTRLDSVDKKLDKISDKLGVIE